MIQRATHQASDVSLIIPAHNAAATLGRCLEAVARGREAPLEVIVADDGSTDETAALAMRHGARLLRTDRRRGPAAARNLGAAAARGTILFFVDADVAIHRDTLARVIHNLSDGSDLAAVFGSYDDAPAHPGLFSQFKNLQHHFVHQRSASEAATFWTACGAVRKETFRAIGGFDERWWTIQDIELGMRLRAAGKRIRLDHALQVTHLKPYTFTGWLRSDICARAIPWSLLILARGRLPNDLNLRWNDRASGILTLATLAVLVAPIGGAARLIGLAAGIGIVAALNGPFLSLLTRRRGIGFAVLALPLLLIHYGGASLAFALAVVLHLAGKRERPFWWPAPLADAPRSTTPVAAGPGTIETAALDRAGARD